MDICVGDAIEFNFFGQLKRGIVDQVGKYGYWIEDTAGCYGRGSIRCPFDGATKVITAPKDAPQSQASKPLEPS